MQQMLEEAAGAWTTAVNMVVEEVGEGPFPCLWGVLCVCVCESVVKGVEEN